MKKSVLTSIKSTLLPGLLTALALLSSQNLQALDNGIDAYNLRKGDWIYILSDATNKLGGNVTSVTNVATLMSYEASQGMSYIVVKASTGSTNFPSDSNHQFTASLVTAAHNAGLKIFGYDRSYGTDVPGEIKIATNTIVLGADGYVIDAESEWESANLPNNTTAATNLLQGIKNVFPTRFLGHSPFMYISLHSTFPYKQFGLFCDAAMPQDYWHEFAISSSQCVSDMDTEWNNWQNGLAGSWTNAIKPIAPIGQGWNGVTSTEITSFYNSLKNDSTPATKIGYQSASWWRADLHTADMWTGIGGNAIGVNPTNNPVISQVASSPSTSTSLITWRTDQSSDSVVEYGLTTSYGTLVTNSTLVVYHGMTLTSLTAGTTYHYRVKSKNQSAKTGISGDFTFTTTSSVADIIIDNTSATITGTWSTGTSSTDKYGSDYRYKSQGTGVAYVTYTPNILTAGNYNVYEWHPQGANRTTAAPEKISYNGGSTTVNVNQTTGGGAWNLLGTFSFAAGTVGYVKISDNFPDATQIIMADAIKWSYVPAGSPPAAPSGLTASAISSSEIDLAWTDNSTNENNFIVARSTVNGGPYTDVATLGSNVTSYNNTGLASNTTYYYVVRARNGNGDSANSNQANATTFQVPPAAPSGLTATTISSSQINLAWTDNSANESAFVVGRSTTSGGPYTDIVSLAANTTSYSDTGLAAATTYYYVVRATNSAGSSANSAQASATTLPLPPAAPSGLTATAISSSEIDLSWTDNSSNESNFIVARSTTTGGPYTDIATLAANTTSYNNTGLTSSTTYYYVVRAINTGGSSANSNEASATTPAGVPAAPSGLTASPISSSAIKLTWTDNSSNESNFVIGRSTTSGGPYTDIVSLAANITTYTNTGLTAGTTYYYVVRATNSVGSSANSNQASAAPVADIIIDNGAATVVGTWSTGTSATDKFGTNYRFIAAGTGSNNLKYSPTIGTAGNYQVYEWHPQGSNRPTDAPIVVNYNGGSVTNRINQQINGGKWNLVNTYNFAAGSTGNVKIQDNFTTPSAVVMADAIKFVLSN